MKALNSVPDEPSRPLLGKTQKEHEAALVDIFDKINTYASTRRSPEIRIRTIDGIWAQMLYQRNQSPVFEEITNPKSVEELKELDFSIIHTYP